MTCIAVIQARMGSSRLPGKVLSQLGEYSMLEQIIKRIERSNQVDQIVVATTIDSNDDPIEELCSRIGISVIRGDTFDVLSRFNLVIDSIPEAEIIVRITADCPFIDPDLIDSAVNYLKLNNLDFVANRLPPPWKRTYPLGLDVEVCTRKALIQANDLAREPFQREHVMPYIYREGSEFQFEILNFHEDLSSFRWTVDTPEDLVAVRELQKLCGPEPFSWLKVLAIAKENPWISKLNSEIKHKSVAIVDERWKQ